MFNYIYYNNYINCANSGTMLNLNQTGRLSGGGYSSPLPSKTEILMLGGQTFLTSIGVIPLGGNLSSSNTIDKSNYVCCHIAGDSLSLGSHPSGLLRSPSSQISIGNTEVGLYCSSSIAAAKVRIFHETAKSDGTQFNIHTTWKIGVISTKKHGNCSVFLRSVGVGMLKKCRSEKYDL